MKQKFKHIKPQLPLYMKPGIIFTNFEIKNNKTKGEGYESKIINIPSFEHIQ